MIFSIKVIDIFEELNCLYMFYDLLITIAILNVSEIKRYCLLQFFTVLLYTKV